jgi:hypothetical protein
MTLRSTAIVFASLLAIAAAPFATAHADTMSMSTPTAKSMPLPGQPGADTSLDQELRGQPYPATTEWSQFKGTAPTMRASHTSSMGIYDSLSLPANLIFS